MEKVQKEWAPLAMTEVSYYVAHGATFIAKPKIEQLITYVQALVPPARS